MAQQGPYIPEQVSATAPKVGQRVGDRDAEWEAATPLSSGDWDAATPLSQEPAKPTREELLKARDQSIEDMGRQFIGAGLPGGAAIKGAGRLAMRAIASPRQVPTGFYDLKTGQPVMEAAKGALPALKSAAGAAVGAAKRYGPPIAKESARAALGGATYAALMRMLGGR